MPPEPVDPCIICQRNAKNVTAGGYDGIWYECPRCGRFKVTGSVLVKVDRSDQEWKAKAAGWIYDQNRLAEFPEIDSDRFGWLLRRPLPGVIERANRLLIFAIGRQGRLGGDFKYADEQGVVASYSTDAADVWRLYEFLMEQEFVVRTGSSATLYVTPKGFARGEELGHNLVPSNQGFVAMWFHDDLKPVFEEGFAPSIENAGYVPRRVDSVEHVGKIDDEIIAQIRKSRFVVADFTGHRGGVYFEAGFALGFGLPVIWTCREDDIDELHFDIRQYNTIVWTDAEDLAARLQNRIEAVIGQGPLS